MNLEKLNLFIVASLSLFLTLMMPVFFLSVRLLFFSPMLVIFFYQRSYLYCLWAALAAGLLLDLLVSETRFGLHAVAYCLTTALLYKQKYNFFSDSLSTLPIMTIFFSLLVTFIQLCVVSVFDRNTQLSMSWLFTDFILMPFVDAAYAFLIFIVPFLCFGKPQRRINEYFVEK